jgi:hypothetical protein
LFLLTSGKNRNSIPKRKKECRGIADWLILQLVQPDFIILIKMFCLFGE